MYVYLVMKAYAGSSIHMSIHATEESAKAWLAEKGNPANWWVEKEYVHPEVVVKS